MSAAPGPAVLAVNAGSSSLRFAVYQSAKEPRWLLGGKIDRLGSARASFRVAFAGSQPGVERKLAAGDFSAATGFLLDWLAAEPSFQSVVAVGHRVVHGLRRKAPARVTTHLLAELRKLTSLAPNHLPRELAVVAAFRQRFPRLPQVVCFDTTFHRHLPPVARRLPIPRRYAARGVERYGFHGLSYAFLMEELTRLDPAGARGRVILAHLGNGASLAAVRDGRCLDTSMGLTPASGLMMGTRSGDLDPGLAYLLARREGLTPAGFQRMVHEESGLLGVSGTSSDVRDLLAKAATKPAAAEALELFCWQARKWIGAFATVLGGLDTVVFSGGIGENAPEIRAGICAGLSFLGLELEPASNARNAALISTERSRVRVRVLATDEELMIARSVVRLLGRRLP